MYATKWLPCTMLRLYMTLQLLWIMVVKHMQSYWPWIYLMLLTLFPMESFVINCPNCPLMVAIRGQLFNWISAFLAGRYQQAVLNGETSRPCPVTSGVPQGSVLGPLFFLCCINDIQKYWNFKKINIKLYADDVRALLYRNIISEEGIHILQEDLNTYGQKSGN